MLCYRYLGDAMKIQTHSGSTVWFAVAALCAIGSIATARAAGQTPAQTPAPKPAPSAPVAQTPASQPAAAPQGLIVEQVLVKVNGDIITKTELEERQIAALRERKVNPEVLKNDEQLKKALADVTPMLLVNAIDELLVVQL